MSPLGSVFFISPLILWIFSIIHRVHIACIIDAFFHISNTPMFYNLYFILFAPTMSVVSQMIVSPGLLTLSDSLLYLGRRGSLRASSSSPLLLLLSSPSEWLPILQTWAYATHQPPLQAPAPLPSTLTPLPLNFLLMLQREVITVNDPEKYAHLMRL